MSLNTDRYARRGRPRKAALVRVTQCMLIATWMLVGGCAGVGIVETSNPATKLEDAEVLYRRENRPLPAEMLIRQAIEIYQRQDDAHGLGHAYRDYGDLLMSPAVSGLAALYRTGKVHFLDPSVTFDNRLAKSKEYMRMALDEYAIAAKRDSDAGHFDGVTNALFNSAWLHILLGEKGRGCADFDRSEAAYHENMRRNPGAHPVVPAGFASLPDAMAAAKREAGCPATDSTTKGDAEG